MSPDTRLMFGLSLILVPTIVYGGLTVLGVVTNRLMGSPGPPNLTARPRPCRSSYIACNASTNRGRLRCDSKCAGLASPSGSTRSINSGFRRILRRGTPTIVAHCSLHRRRSGRGDNPHGRSWLDPFAIRINSIQRDATAHSLPQGKVGWCHPEHAPERSGQVCRIGEPGIVSSCGHSATTHQVAAGALQA